MTTPDTGIRDDQEMIEILMDGLQRIWQQCRETSQADESGTAREQAEATIAIFEAQIPFYASTERLTHYLEIRSVNTRSEKSD